MYKILFLVLFIVINGHSLCITYDLPQTNQNITGLSCNNNISAGNGHCGTCTSECSKLSSECTNGIIQIGAKLYTNGSINGTISRCDYTEANPPGNTAPFICGYAPRGLCSYYTVCDTSDLDSLNCARDPSGEGCPQILDTVCVNIPLSISAQLGTSARSYYEKSPDGTLKKILNDGNDETLCRKSSDVGTGDITIINNLIGPDGTNYGTFCQGSCESVGQSNGGAVTCSGIGCHESHDQTGAINPNNYGGGSGDFGAGTGGGFGSGGGSGSGSGGFVGDSLGLDTSETSNSWAGGCNVLNLQTCTCDGFTYVGSSGNTATVYNHSTGQTGTCGLDFMPEVATCPVDWTTCTFKKNSNDTTDYKIDSMRVDSSGDWEYNYYPILGEINASIKALDFNQNSNAKDMKNFFENYKGSNFEGIPKQDTTIINITNRDTSIIDFPDTTINHGFGDSVANWRQNVSQVVDSLESFTFFNPDTTALEIDTSGAINGIIGKLTPIIEDGKTLFPLDFSSFSGASNCPAFLSRGLELKTYVGSSHSFSYGTLCQTRIFGKEIFALIRSVLRLLVSVGCAWVIFKATVGFRGE